jgi:hypothetical protein
MTARTSYADLGWRPDCENEPDHDWTSEEWPDVDTAEWPDDDEDAVPVRVDDDHPDLNDLPDPWADSKEIPW